MKKLVILCLTACLGTSSLQAQITLPTKKTNPTTGSTAKPEKKATPKTEQKAEKKVEQKATPQQAVPQTPPKGTITLPTVAVKKETTTTEPTATTTTGTPVLAGGELKPLPVVVRKTAPRAKPIAKNKKPKPEDNEIYESAEHMPTYPGGVNALMEFIDSHRIYPQEALANDSVEDVTIIQVSFIVEKDGTPKDFQVIDEHDPYLEAEAVRILQDMPKWKPATQKGVKVRVEYVVPVKFKKPNQ